MSTTESYDPSGLALPTSLEELESEFEPCGGFLRRKGASRTRPSCVLDAAKVVKLVREFQKGLDSRG